MENDNKSPYQEIVKQYPDEWIYLGIQEFDGDRIINAILIGHNKDKGELARQNIGKGIEFST